MCNVLKKGSRFPPKKKIREKWKKKKKEKAYPQKLRWEIPRNSLSTTCGLIQRLADLYSIWGSVLQGIECRTLKLKKRNKEKSARKQLLPSKLRHSAGMTMMSGSESVATDRIRNTRLVAWGRENCYAIRSLAVTLM